VSAADGDDRDAVYRHNPRTSEWTPNDHMKPMIGALYWLSESSTSGTILRGISRDAVSLHGCPVDVYNLSDDSDDDVTLRYVSQCASLYCIASASAASHQSVTCQHW